MSVSQITFASSFSYQLASQSSPKFWQSADCALQRKRKERSSIPSSSLATEHQFPSPRYTSGHFMEWRRAIICSRGNREWGQMSGCQAWGLDVLRWALIMHRVPTRGQWDWQKANISFSAALFAYLHHVLTKHHPHANANCAFTQVPNWKQTFLFFEIFLGLLMLLFKTVCLKRKEPGSYRCKWRYI